MVSCGMSFIFICCCRPFLRGRDDSTEFYNLLGLQKGATVDEIKRAYRNKSLQMHPDKLAQRGQTLTPEAQAQFQRMKEAYECLVDPVKKRNYDELGEFGMKFLDDPSTVDPQVLMSNFVRSSSVDRCAIFSGILGIAAFILLFPVLLCLKADGSVNIPWTGVWGPVWVLDGLVFWVLLVGALIGPQAPPEGLEGEYKDDWPLRVLNFVWFCANLLFQIFLTMKLDQDIDWTWAKVFAPWFVWEGFNFLTTLPYAIQTPPDGFQAAADEPTLQVRMLILSSRESFVRGLLRTIFCILVVLKLDAVLAISWWTVFTPLWVYFGVFFVLYWGSYTRAKIVLWHLQHQSDIEAGSQEETLIREEAELMANRSSFQCCSLAVLLTFTLLAVARIAGAHYTVFIIFIPLFILVGCFTCFVGCGICCITDQAMTEMEGTPLNQAGGPPGSSGSSTPGHSPTRTTTGGAAAPQPASSSTASSGGAAPYRPPTAARAKSPSPSSSPVRTGLSPADVSVSVEPTPSSSSSRAPAPAPVDANEID